MNIYNIPTNYHFFNSFCEWLRLNFGDNLNNAIIIFPNQRACREFRKIYGNHKDIKTKAIADICSEDFYDFFTYEKISKTVDEINKIKGLNAIDYLFFLTSEIVKTRVFGENISFTQALSIALQLKNLFDEIERQEIDLNRLYDIDDSDLAAHRQFTLEFLKKFYINIKNSVIKNDIFSDVNYQNFIINHLTFNIEKSPLDKTVIIAGSTGSVNFSKKLIKAIANNKNGHVVLYGLQANLVEAEEQSHPQYILYELLKFLNCDNVKKIIFEQYLISNQDRSQLVLSSMLPSAQTHHWQKISQILNNDLISQDIWQNFCYIETKNEIEESRIAALAAAEMAMNKKTVAIISNDYQFVELVKSQLNNFSLQFNDARSLNIYGLRIINMINLLIELVENDFDSSTLLALLKHPWSIFSEQKENLKKFEMEIIRAQRSKEGLAGITEKLKFADESLQNYFNDFYQAISSFLEVYDKTDLAFYVDKMIIAVENLSQKTWSDLLLLEPAQEEVAQLFNNLKKQQNFIILRKDAKRFFDNLFSQICYFEKSDAMAPIQILSSIEARLLNFDRVIITSLNQGDFPQIEGENWLGKKIRSELGIDLSEKKYGQSSYDFCNYLSNKSVFLLRSKTKSGAPAIASSFVLRLEILCKKMGISFDKGKKYFDLLEKIDLGDNAVEATESAVVEVRVPIEFRPKRISITEISRLLSDSYQIYAKRILQLQELNKIDYEPEYREFGTFVHKALEEFIKNPNDKDFIKKTEIIFKKYFLNKEAKLIWWPKFENIFRDFYEKNNAIEASYNYVEVPTKILINDILISGKIDRIIIDNNNHAHIFDYKTGPIAATKKLSSGQEPQLAVYALMLYCGMLEDKNLNNYPLEKISSLNYWKLSATSEAEVRPVFKDPEEIAIIVNAAKNGLEKLTEYFNCQEATYTAALEPKRLHEYSHLARIF